MQSSRSGETHEGYKICSGWRGFTKCAHLHAVLHLHPPFWDAQQGDQRSVAVLQEADWRFTQACRGAEGTGADNGLPDEKSWASGGSTAVATGGTREGADDAEGERGTAQPMVVTGDGCLRAAVLREGFLAGPAGIIQNRPVS